MSLFAPIPSPNLLAEPELVQVPAGEQDNLGENWQRFIPKDGEFSVLMPGTPREEIEENPDSVFYLYLADQGADKIYGVFYARFLSPPPELNPDELDELYRSFVDGFLEDWSQKQILKEEPITLGSFPGKEYEVQGSEGRAKLRVYWANSRLYVVLAVSKTQGTLPGQIDTFLDSFQLL
ncbi:MAG: hypothetical protein HC920_05335 [Oscillatoriales cyanobacterium SM2_3_0]|nr:hypothetical protein [Oscillatoriales cyanobacterium SM2_3_0]